MGIYVWKCCSVHFPELYQENFTIAKDSGWASGHAIYTSATPCLNVLENCCSYVLQMRTANGSGKCPQPFVHVWKKLSSVTVWNQSPIVLHYSDFQVLNLLLLLQIECAGTEKIDKGNIRSQQTINLEMYRVQINFSDLSANKEPFFIQITGCKGETLTELKWKEQLMKIVEVANFEFLSQ